MFEQLIVQGGVKRSVIGRLCLRPKCVSRDEGSIDKICCCLQRGEPDNRPS
jgi:hypothetical protein